MITNSKEQRICDKYSQPDRAGKIRCCDCPLRKGIGSYDYEINYIPEMIVPIEFKSKD